MWVKPSTVVSLDFPPGVHGTIRLSQLSWTLSCGSCLWSIHATCHLSFAFAAIDLDRRRAAYHGENKVHVEGRRSTFLTATMIYSCCIID